MTYTAQQLREAATIQTEIERRQARLAKILGGGSPSRAAPGAPPAKKRAAKKRAAKKSAAKKPSATKRATRKMSAKGLANIRAAQKKRWAMHKKKLQAESEGK